MNDFETIISKFYELKRGNEDLNESNKRQQQMLAQLQESDHIELIEMLHRDIKKLILEYNESPSQTKRRGLFRAIFAYIEGSLFVTKEELVIEESHKRKPNLSIEEIMLLKEKIPFIDNKGKLRSSVKYSELSANILFTIFCYNKSAHTNISINKNDLEWKCLTESIFIRNRTTHPKHASEIDISDNELAKVVIGYIYFKKLIIDLNNEKTLNLKNATPGQIKF